MIYVTYTNKSFNTQGHVYKESLKEFRPREEAPDVIEVQADESELMFILDNFKGIPTSTVRVQKWGPPWAQFICDNMP